MTRLYEALGQGELRFAQACVVLMTLLVLVSATARTAGSPLSWTVDLATFLFAWSRSTCSWSGSRPGRARSFASPTTCS
jgi:TRAP-type C4-dicarboxylate transport system permease small subunit